MIEFSLFTIVCIVSWKLKAFWWQIQLYALISFLFVLCTKQFCFDRSTYFGNEEIQVADDDLKTVLFQNISGRKGQNVITQRTNIATCTLKLITENGDESIHTLRSLFILLIVYIHGKRDCCYFACRLCLWLGLYRRHYGK